MAWRRIGDKPLSEPMLIRFIDAYMQWVKMVFSGMGISIIKIRRLWDHLIFVTGISVLVRHFYIETDPKFRLRINTITGSEIWKLLNVKIWIKYTYFNIWVRVILYGISNGTIEVPYKISLRYIETCDFLTTLEFKTAWFKSSYGFCKRPQPYPSTYTHCGLVMPYGHTAIGWHCFI